MKTLPKYLQDQKNEMTYVLHGDYYFPDLKLSNSDKTPISHYGRMRLKHLQMNRPGRILACFYPECSAHIWLRSIKHVRKGCTE